MLGRIRAPCAGDRGRHDSGKLGGRCDGRARPRTPPTVAPMFAASHNRLCNRNSKPFFPIGADHAGEFIERDLRQPVGRARALGRIHAHVERAVAAQ